MDKARAEEWIGKLKTTAVPLTTRPGTNWSLLFEYPAGKGTRIAAYAPKDAQGVAVRMELARPFSPEQRAKEAALQLADKKIFYAELQQAFQGMSAQQVFLDIQQTTDANPCPRALCLSVNLTDDATFEAFESAVNRLSKADEAVSRCVGKHLGKPGKQTQTPH
jgi:hypothetical protein